MANNSGLKELVPVEATGDIPWGMIKTRQILPEKNWLTPQNFEAARRYEIEMRKKGRKPSKREIDRLANLQMMRLERVELINGLRYAVIRDAETGEETFAETVYLYGTEDDGPSQTQAEATHTTDLGNGYRLGNLFAEKNSSIRGRKKSWAESTVVKELSVNPNPAFPNPNVFRYRIDPHIRFFDGAYHFKNAGEATSVYAKTEDKVRTHFKGTAFSVCTANTATRDQINFIFDPEEGRLKEIQLQGVSILGMEGAKPEVGWRPPGPGQQRGDFRVEGDNLKHGRARLIVQRLLGVKYTDKLTLDKRKTLDALIENADTLEPHRRNPREILVFKDAVRQPDWHPALPDKLLLSP